MSMEDRVAELELALENLLECFEETPVGVDVETEEGVAHVTEATAEIVIQAREVLDHDVED